MHQHHILRQGFPQIYTPSKHIILPVPTLPTLSFDGRSLVLALREKENSAPRSILPLPVSVVSPSGKSLKCHCKGGTPAPPGCCRPDTLLYTHAPHPPAHVHTNASLSHDPRGWSTSRRHLQTNQFMEYLQVFL